MYQTELAYQSVETKYCQLWYQNAHNHSVLNGMVDLGEWELFGEA